MLGDDMHYQVIRIEDINLKFLKSLPSDWRTHTLTWRNKTDLEEKSLDDFFNSLKIYEAEVKISVAASVYAISAKIPISSLLNIIDDDLEEMDLKWQMGMLTVRARRFLQRTRRNLGSNGPTSIGFDMSKVECYNCHRKGHFARECRSPKDTIRNDEEPTNYALMAFSSSSSSSDNECDNYLSSGSDQSLPPSPTYDRCQSGNGYHAVPLPYTRTFMPPKPDLVFNNAPYVVETDHLTFVVKLSPTKPNQDLSHTNRPSAPIIEEWVSDSEDESEIKTPQNVLSFVQSTEQVNSPRPFVQYVETSIPAVTPKPSSLKPTSNGKHRNKKACFVCKSLDYLIKDCNYHEKKMAQPTARNHAQWGTHKQYAQMTHLNP
nr:hypothetical protein [Tanacetum cinerariifolium]